MGQADGGIHLVEGPDDVAQLQVQFPDNLAYVTQTTLSVDDTAKVIDALRQRYPKIEGPRKDDICYATQNRQDAVKTLAQQCDLVLVVGSRNSSNSNRLREIAEQQGVPAYLIDGPEDIRDEWLADTKRVGITAGASAPELLVQQVAQRLEGSSGQTADEVQGPAENVAFSLPTELRG